MAETIGAAMAAATVRLRAAGVESARGDARILACRALGVDTAVLVAHPERELSAAEAAAFATMVARRERRKPVSRILGEREFYGLRFALGAETLDPRPDSETAVEAALERLAGIAAPRVLDLGTGTGCLLLAVLANRTDAHGVGIDAADGALATAAANAAALGLAERAAFLHRDWTQTGWMEGLGGPFDLAIANPPYIPDADVAGLEPEVAAFDPIRALAGGADGLDPYRILVPALKELLRPGGHVAFEVGIGQSDAVAALMTAAGLTVCEVRRDLGGVARCVVGRRDG